jgi:RimJ/RimL family protein N-acetyltransferase
MIRLARPDDRDAIIDLVLGIQNGEFRLNITLAEQDDLLDVAAHYLDGGGFWVATTARGEIIGSIGLMRKSAQVAVLKKFFLKPAYRGRVLGHAQALFDALLAVAKHQGIAQIILDTPSVAVRSHRYYESVGFRRIGRDELPVAYDYPDRDSLLYSLELRENAGAVPR